MAAAPKFPLPKAYFDNQGPPLSHDQQEVYRATARARIDAVLQAEREHVRIAHRQVSASHWKLLKKRKDMRIYKRRPQPGDSDSQPTMLGVGRMDGTLEDLIYGTYDKSYEEMKTTMSYVDIFTKDCNVLHTLELATPEDPFHYVGIKWALSQLPGKLFVKPRDWCYIEAMGITKDADGKRYGYTIVHSSDVPNCPPFDPRAVVRGRGSLSFIYREAEDTPGVVEIFAQGLFDPAGELIQYFSVIMTTEIFSGQALTVRCAEAKKLTLLALRNYRSGKRESLKKTCFLCVRSDSMFKALKLCNICGATTCDRCRVKRQIFMGANHSVCDVACCQSCVLEARDMPVRPAESSFSIHSSPLPQGLVQGTIHSSSSNSSSGQSRSNASSTASWAHKVQTSNRSASELETSDDDKFSSYTSMDETDFEKMIEALIDQRHQELGTSRANSQQIEHLSSGYDNASDAVVVAVPQQQQEQEQQQPQMSVVDEQAAMFQKMLALQSAATQVYEITQANEEYMKKL
ncbi:hypothetical protein Gpo141_00003584 [Globisporangium polare]